MPIVLMLKLPYRRRDEPSPNYLQPPGPICHNTHSSKSCAYVKGRTRLNPLRSTILAKNLTTSHFNRSIAAAYACNCAFADATSILDLLIWQCRAALEIRNKQVNEH